MVWWVALHGLLGLTTLMANLPLTLTVVLSLALCWHARRRFPAACPLLVVSPGGRFGLPAEGRFDLRVGAGTAIGGVWLELVFDDKPRARLILLRDQFTAPDWRRLRLAVKEGE